MSGPYVSSRSGRFAWMMQRVTAALLVPMAFIHFAMQHFTSDAVSTGLATAFRLHNPFWVAFYMVFVVCVLYHGVNGTIGIVRDYAPKPLQRAIIVVVLWTLAVFFGVLGIRNVVAPAHTLESAKNWYTLNGFPEGESAGNPPNFLWKPRYDFGEELRELNLLNYYLEHHTVRTEDNVLSGAEIFNGAEYGDDTHAGGTAFDTWALGIIARVSMPIKTRRADTVSSAQPMSLPAGRPYPQNKCRKSSHKRRSRGRQRRKGHPPAPC